MLNVLTEKQVEEVVESRPVGSAAEVRRMEDWLSERIKKGSKSPVAEVVTLTPVLASLLLQRNPVNRPMARYNIDTLKADTSNDRFMFNGESIVVSDSGVLIDGQHRCAVVVETRKPIQTVIVFGPKEDARYTIDIGKPKSAGNFLHMKGGVDTNHMAAVLGMLVQFAEHGTLVYGSMRATKVQIVNAFERYKGVDASLAICHDATKAKIGSRSALAFAHYLMKRKAGAEAADYFIRKIVDGDDLRKGNPIYHARERLLKCDRGTRVEIRVEILFKGWNAWRRNETVTSIRTTGVIPKLEK
jgi:hypothetical protein